MRLLVLGATGGTGRQIVRLAQAAGHGVSALVRDPGKAAPALPGATLIAGDARDPGAVGRALQDSEAVICALGTGISPWRQVTLLSSATRILVEAMQRHGPHRLVCITGIGAGDSRGHGGFLYDRLFQPLLLGPVYADKDRQEAIVRASTLDWVLVRPTALKNTPATGRIHATTDLSRLHGGQIPRADVASFVIEQVRVDTWLKQSPVITSAS